MKKLLFFAFLALTLASFRSDNSVQEYLGVKGPLHFDGKTFELKWTSKNGNYYIQEYLQAADTFPRFNEMISLFVLNEPVSLLDAVAIKQMELEESKKTDPVCNYAISEGANKQELVVDFLRAEFEGEHTTLVEFNIYRYRQIKLGSNKKAILVFAFTKQVTGYEITPFLQGLVQERPRLLGQMNKTHLPTIKLSR